MIDRTTKDNLHFTVRLVQFTIFPENEDTSASSVELHIVLFPGDAFPYAKQFWQHTGLCVSSRLSERCLALLGEESAIPDSSTVPPVPPHRPAVKPGNRHYAAKGSFSKSPPTSPLVPHAKFGNGVKTDASPDLFSRDHLNYLEERYGRNMPLESVAAAKRAMRRRIAGVLLRDTPNDWSTAVGHEVELGPSTRGVEGVTENDVFLYAGGMSAIWSAHQLALATRPSAKSICFGYVVHFSFTRTYIYSPS